MNWFKLLHHDLRKGLLRKRYLTVPLFFAASCLVCGLQMPGDMSTPGFMDRMLFCFKGLPPLTGPQDFQLPVLWFLILAGCLFLNLDYLLDDLTQEGQQVMVRSVSRRGWYLSKCVWGLFSCGLFLAIGMLTCFIITWLCGGKLSLTNDVLVSQISLGAWAEQPLTVAQAVLIGIVLPYLTLAGFQQLQMILCLYIKPILSFLICICGLVAALLFSFSWIPGNGAITARSDLLMPGLLHPLPLLITGLCLWAAGVIAGMIRFSRMDLLRYEGE